MSGTTIYVGRGGDDQNDGLDPSRPFATLTRALVELGREGVERVHVMRQPQPGKREVWRPRERDGFVECTLVAARDCQQDTGAGRCQHPADYRFTWPGKDERLACFHCAQGLERLAQAIGLHLQFVPLCDALGQELVP